MVVCDRQISYRPGLVGLALLAAAVFECKVWAGYYTDRSAAHRYLYHYADIGSIGGGWLSSTFIKRGWSVNFGRKISMLISAVCVIPVVFATLTPNLWTSVLLISLAAAAHQGWSANIFTTASDMFPRQAVGSVVGFGGMTGSIGGMILGERRFYRRLHELVFFGIHYRRLSLSGCSAVDAVVDPETRAGHVSKRVMREGHFDDDPVYNLNRSW